MARVLITGASVAGNTAAWWLSRYGCDVTVVERAPDFRDGGQNLDVRGWWSRRSRASTPT